MGLVERLLGEDDLDEDSFGVHIFQGVLALAVSSFLGVDDSHDASLSDLVQVANSGLHQFSSLESFVSSST